MNEFLFAYKDGEYIGSTVIRHDRDSLVTFSAIDGEGVRVGSADELTDELISGLDDFDIATVSVRRRG